jgi:uncharacterized protein
MIRFRILTIALLAFLINSLLPFAVQAADQIDLGQITEKHVMIPMRDGVKLSAYLYFPPGAGPWPVLSEQRYASFKGANTRKQMAKLAEGGYVVAGVNFRGSQLSEGTFVGYRDLGWGEKKDGYDIIEWLGVQKWSNGKVGTFGSSQAGYAQNFQAVTQPPHLVCQYMTDTGLSLYHEGYRIGGTTRPTRFKNMDRVCRNPKDNQDLMKEWYQHPTYDEYWQAEDCSRHFDKMNVPCFTIGSWYDFMCVGSVQSFIGRQHRAGSQSVGKQKLLIGPWLHGRLNKTNQVRDVKYPLDANVDVQKSMLKWFDYHMKGIGKSPYDEPAVKYYVMGAVGEENAPGNEWRTADDWPIPSRQTDYYLQADGNLELSLPTVSNSSTAFTADPFHPAEILGRSFLGAKNAQPYEKQAEVKTFTTEPLNEAVEWTGLVKTELYVSSSAKDTDFIVRVTDVYPDGRSILIVDMIRRARFREGFEKEVLMESGKIYKLAFNIGWLSQNFNKGHRIRITVASTGAPFYEPNPNTGEPLTIEPPKNQVIAENRVHHDKIYHSKIIAPVVK